MLLKALVAARDLGRLHEIAGVLLRHGFGDLVHRTGIVAALEATGRVLHIGRGGNRSSMAPSERMRRVLEELGPTFVKLGQVLATRRDLLGPEWIEQFSRLHEDVATLPVDALREQLEADLGRSASKAFASVDEVPLAAGSIAQVHRARMHDGRDVVLKIRRPGIEEEVRADLRLLERFAELLEQEIPEVRRFHPRRVAKQFGRTIRAELDFRIEARNLSQISHNLVGHEKLVTPKVLSEFTCERLLVMTFVEGVSAAAFLRGEPAEGVDAKKVAQHGAEAVLGMVFVDGLYHADPHPGNVLFLPDSKIALLDFGMVGRLSERRRREFVSLIGAIAEHDEDGLVDVLLEWSDGDATDLDMLTQDARAMLDRYYGVPLKDLDVPGMLRDIADVVRENDLALPSDVAMLLKVFVTLEGLGSALDPEFDMSAHVEPAARKMMKRLHSPRVMAARGLRDVRRIVGDLPRDLRSIMTRARRGRLRIQLDLHRLEEFGRQFDHSVNRLTGGIITASLIVGTAIVMTVDKGPLLFDFPVIGLLGFLTSMAFGVMLLWSIIRSGRS